MCRALCNSCRHLVSIGSSCMIYEHFAREQSMNRWVAIDFLIAVRLLWESKVLNIVAVEPLFSHPTDQNLVKTAS